MEILNGKQKNKPIEEKISKKKAIELFESGYLDSLEARKYNK